MNAPLPQIATHVDINAIAVALGVSRQAAQDQANKESWPFEVRKGRGGPKHWYERAKLPKEVASAIQAKIMQEILLPPGAGSSLPAPVLPGGAVGAVAAGPSYLLDDTARLGESARTGVLAAVDRLTQSAGCSREAAITVLLTQAKAGMLDEVTTAQLKLAKTARGRKGNGFPSARTLKRWLQRQRSNDLAPRKRQKDMGVPAWASAFLNFYQQPQKPSVQESYRDFLKTWDGEPVSVHQVRRFLAKIGTVSLAEGRMLPREIKAIKPFVRRTFEHLLPNDVWSADGHTFDAEVQHPLTGRPFRPEITAIVDIRTRRAMGFSVDLAESSFAVLDAIRHAVERNGIPAIFYVDNGSGYKNNLISGYKNALISDNGIGLMGRLGCDVKYSLPYNSQARGVIERLHQTLLVQAAKRLPSYIGAKMDREAKLLNFKITRKAIKQGGALPMLPWESFIAYCNEQIAEYNARPHRSLKGKSPDQVWEDYRAQGWEPHTLHEGEADSLFRPRIARTVARGEVKFSNNIYFSNALTEFHGDAVQIAYDIHDAHRVWVYDSEGKFITTAEFMANAQKYFPDSVVDQARDKRAAGRRKLAERKIEEIEAERTGRPALEIVPDLHAELIRQARDMMVEPPEPALVVVDAEKPAEESAPVERDTPEKRYRHWLQLNAIVEAGSALSGDELKRWGLYQKSNEYRAQQRLHQEKSQSTAAR